MSTPYPKNQSDPLSLIPFDEALLDSMVAQAQGSDRKRAMLRFHEFADVVQRMLNAVEPTSYVRPHRHVNPDRPEAFVLLRGAVLLVRFSDDGAPMEGVVIDADGPVRGAEVPGGAWHCFVALRSGTVVFEAAQGPYNAAANKEFAAWAPTEEDAEANRAFMAGLKGRFRAALERIEAAEDEIC